VGFVVGGIRHFAVIGHRFLRKEDDGLLRRCMSDLEMPSILAACHDSTYGGHFSGQLTGQKILRACYFWPNLFKDAHDYVKICDDCQRYPRIHLCTEISLHVS
jgi:predicted SAM-dependent methyltransferase